jgi:hypothetical protein
MTIVSYDFDGVLHLDVIGIHPIDFRAAADELRPARRMVEMLRRDARDHEIVIVSARSYDGPILDFVRHHGLPVKRVYVTNNGDKMPLLRRLGAIRHYDDNRDMVDELLSFDTLELHLVSDDEVVEVITGDDVGELVE